MADAPKFVENDPNQIVQEMVLDYQSRTGKVLQPAQIEYILINVFAYRESLTLGKINSAAAQNLVQFSTAPILDYLGDLVGVKRLPPAPAECTIQFTLVDTHSAIVIPEGTRIASSDGKVVFATKSALSIAEDVTTGSVGAVAQTDGVIGNGYVSGTITELLDPQPFVTGASNTSTTVGGASQESDEGLRERIILAPSAFSNAGSRDAYKYWARTASALIADVAVLGPPDVAPGNVEIFPMMEDGSETPPEILTAVNEACNDEKIRPLTDTVNVTAPTIIEFTLTVELTLLTTAVQADVEAAVESAVNEFLRLKRGKLGQDILISQLTAVCMVAGVYDVEFDTFTDIIVDKTEFAFATSVTVTTVGTNEG